MMPEQCEVGNLYAERIPIHPAWVQTVNSGAVCLVNPKIEQVKFEAIALGLARCARFAGHTIKFYSVAQHLAAGAEAVLRDTGRRDWAAAYLLHDAHEAYIGDDTSPKMLALASVADQLYGSGEIIRRTFRSLKNRLDSVIYPAAGILWPLDPETHHIVKEYDLRMCRTERDLLMTTPPHPWADVLEQAEPIEGVDLEFWWEDRAYSTWMEMLEELCG